MRNGFSLVLGVALMMGSVKMAEGACAAPSSSGLALCFPSNGSTVLYPATMELAANSGGQPITHVTVYDGNTASTQLDFLPSQLVDFGLKNGAHRLTVNAWDRNGKLYQARATFTITGFGVGSCAPTSAAINLCSPTASGSVPESSVPIAAAFGATVKSWSVALDGHPVINSTQYGRAANASLSTGSFAAAGSHTLTLTATDSHGVVSKVTRSFATFYDHSCSPTSGSCRPGIVFSHPTDIDETTAGDEATTFSLQAEVTGNPKPTTRMAVYLDGVKVQENSGPQITTSVHGSAGSHYVVVQAWDTAGRLYEKYGNVNLK